MALNSLATTSGTIKVSKGDGSEGVEGISDNYFTIEDPYISIVGPTSGTVYRLYGGDEYWWTRDTWAETEYGQTSLGYPDVDYKLWWNRGRNRGRDGIGDVGNKIGRAHV